MVFVFYLGWLFLLLRSGFLFYRFSVLSDDVQSLELRKEVFFLGMINLIVFLVVWFYFKEAVANSSVLVKVFFIVGFIWFLNLWRLFLKAGFVMSKRFYYVYVIFWIIWVCASYWIY
jgi:hypothetical protein